MHCGHRPPIRAAYDASTDPVPRLVTGAPPCKSRPCELPAGHHGPHSSHLGLKHTPSGVPPTPAAMLGERHEGYVQGIARSMSILAEYGSDMVRASDLYERLDYLKREAGAREGRTIADMLTPDNRLSVQSTMGEPSCWQCEKPLGSTEACLTCSAKQAEDAARARGPDGKVCPACGRKFATTSSRDAHQTTAHTKPEGQG
jgi:hypothetical protein